ncbi:MAG: hypothetical protein KDC46_02645 [Thermoleophilia bacterium]|nr:hypothetical protein [Thermoleophilia bacterium]
MNDIHSTDAIARSANAVNNSMHQGLRLDRWGAVRDSLWSLLDPITRTGARVALVGAGSCDDVPLLRLVHRAGSIDLIDFDPDSVSRAVARVPRGRRRVIRFVETDVTGGSADVVLRAVRDGSRLPEALPLPYGKLGSGDYDVVVGDMLYTQLLHSGLLALGVHGRRQHELMRRYDPHLTNALVQRIQASLARGGHAVHVHDVACWTKGQDQPVSLDDALEDPDGTWRRLRRHDACDPHLVLERLGASISDTAWWRWPFEPRKQFLVRASVARTTLAGPTTGVLFRDRLRSVDRH